MFINEEEKWKENKRRRYSPSLFPFIFTVLPCLQLALAPENSTLGQVLCIHHPAILVENMACLLKKKIQASYDFPTLHSADKHPAMVPQSSVSSALQMQSQQ